MSITKNKKINVRYHFLCKLGKSNRKKYIHLYKVRVDKGMTDAHCKNISMIMEAAEINREKGCSE